MFIIEDEIHAEHQKGEYTTYREALAELHKRAKLPWDKPPNVAPCKSWRTCGRRYVVIEYDTSQQPWIQLQRKAVLNISADNVTWVATEI